MPTNSSGTTGVSWKKSHKKCQVNIQVNIGGKYLGAFVNKEDAIKVRKEAEEKRHKVQPKIIEIEENLDKFPGVSFIKRLERWQAYISINKKQTYLGTFKTKAEAIEARKLAEDKYYEPVPVKNGIDLNKKVLDELFFYCKNTGKLFYRERTLKHFSHCKFPHRSLNKFNSHFANKEGSYGKHGISMSINNKGYFAHRIIYIMMTGEDIKGLFVYHKDGNKLNNRFENLVTKLDKWDPLTSIL